MVYRDNEIFDHRGLVRPFLDSPAGTNRSPYSITLVDFVNRFSVGCMWFDKQKRITIIRGFLEYRKMLHAAGIVAGYQWSMEALLHIKSL